MAIAILLFLLAIIFLPVLLPRVAKGIANQPVFFIIFGLIQATLGLFLIISLLKRSDGGWTIGVVYLVVGLSNLLKAIRLFREPAKQAPDTASPTTATIAQAAEPPDVPVPPRGRAYLTFSLLALLTGIFVLEQLLSVTLIEGLFKIGVPSLVGMGGLNRTLVVQFGQWPRIFSSIFLHGDGAHLLFNCITLWFTGWLLENRIGRPWFLATFLVGGVCGSILSLTLNAENIVGVGASGAITSLLAAGFVINFRLPEGRDRAAMQLILLRLLIPAVAPVFFTTQSIKQIDYAAHLGGAIAGMALGALIVHAWPRVSSIPGRRQIAFRICAVLLIPCLYSAIPVIARYRGLERDFTLIPMAALPKSDDGGTKQSFGLVALYPRDPRAHLLRGAALLGAGDAPGAEREARIGLSEPRILASFFLPELTSGLHGILAQALVAQGRPDSAISELDQAIQHNPIPGLYEIRGYALQDVGRWKESGEDFAKVLIRGGGSAGAYYGAGIDSFVLGNYGAAVLAFQEATRLDPKKEYGPL